MGTEGEQTWIFWQLSLVSALLREGAWVTRPERPKGAKDEVKGPEGPPTRSRAPRLLVYYIVASPAVLCFSVGTGKLTSAAMPEYQY